MNFMLLGMLLSLSVISGLMLSSWIMIILLMELGLFFFMFLGMEYSSLSISRSCLKYFFIQSISSLLLLLSGLLVVTMLDLTNYLIHFIFLTGLLMKLGAFPMMFWVIPVLSELPLIMIGILGCPLKVLPLMIYSGYYSMFSMPFSINLMNIMSLLTMASGVWLGLYIKTLRGMLGASSISHTGWFILSAHSASLMKYFMCYTLSLVLLLLALWGGHVMMGAVNLLAMAGLPPFSVFVGKVIVIYSSFLSNISEMFLLLVLLVSGISLFYYLKFSFFLYMYSNMLHYKLNISVALSFMLNCLFALAFIYI